MVSKSLQEIFEEVSRKEPIVKDAEASYRDKEEAERLKNEGNDLMKQERYEDALKNYTKAIQLDNKNPVAAAYSKLSNHVFALEDCQRAIEIDPKYSKAYGRMGLAYASMNDHAKAKQFYEKAIELDPYNETFRNNLRIAEEKKMEQQRENPFLNLFNDIGIESMMSNPAVLNFASRMMSGDQSAQSAFSQMLGSFVPNAGNPDNGENRQEGGMPDFSHFLRAFGILANHVPVLAVIKPGVVTVFEEDGSANKFFDSSVQVLAEEAVPVDWIDPVIAKDILSKAQTDFNTANTEQAKAEAQLAIELGEALIKANE
ncbi:hypothetical protein RND71_044167 [Anisodus tanguticus]|uniref:Uncharacterized protein n=1 Tax=Anisodus tanguticus TaxID=243964 RepID=A0AAE1QPE1_9SOLA|nr:hypothetical protein RND71_044167 [Anisodus tanguticus]